MSSNPKKTTEQQHQQQEHHQDDDVVDDDADAAAVVVRHVYCVASYIALFHDCIKLTNESTIAMFAQRMHQIRTAKSQIFWQREYVLPHAFQVCIVVLLLTLLWMLWLWQPCYGGKQTWIEI